MEYLLSSPLKLNLTLRITGRKENGLHELQSVFFRIEGPETLLVRTPSPAARDRIAVYNCVIKNENIIDKALKLLRKANLARQPVEIELYKAIPPGTGLGAGSGNAAALVEWARRTFGGPKMFGFEKEIGADVPFLCSSIDIARVGGVGEKLDPIPGTFRFSGLVLIPAWRSDTGKAYLEIDRKAAGRWMPEEKAIEESETVLSLLASGRKAGLLPNDFLGVLLERHNEYDEFFSLVEKAGALAWGLSGSGSAAFALFPHKADCRGCGTMLAQAKGIERIFYWE